MLAACFGTEEIEIWKYGYREIRVCNPFWDLIEWIEKLHVNVTVDDGIQILVEWQGLPDEIDRKFEPVMQIAQDISDKLDEFLKIPGKKPIKQKAIAQLNEHNK